MPESVAASGGARTVLGFDYGRRRIGVAVGQELLATARPLATLRSHDGLPDWAGVARLLAAWRPALLVVGVPRHADGGANAVTLAALEFGRQLSERFGLPVETMDEHLSSWDAEQRLNGQKTRNAGGGVDAVAAALILDSWFSQRSRPV